MWSRKKIVIWQVGTLVLAPAVIALMAGVAIPATIVACPIYAGTTVRTNLKKVINHLLDQIAMNSKKEKENEQFSFRATF